MKAFTEIVIFIWIIIVTGAGIYLAGSLFVEEDIAGVQSGVLILLLAIPTLIALTKRESKQ